MVIARERKEEFLSIDHINFQMSDLVDAVMVKKSEVNSILDKYGIEKNDDMIDEKIRDIREKYIGDKENKKVLKNNYDPR